MLGKLIKHEYIYLLKRFSIFYIIYLCSALLVKVFTLIDIDYDPDNPLYYTLTAAIMCVSMVYMVFTGFLALMTVIDNMRRFKKNMFSDEGYLTNTLPVTATEHIVAKIIAGATNYIVSLLIIFLGLLIVVSSEALEILRVFGEVLEEITVSQFFCMLLMMVTGYIAFMLFGYFLCSINSMANSKGCVGGILGIAIFFFNVMALSWIFTGIEMNNVETPEAFMLIFSAYFAVVGAIMYFLTVNIIKKHLNLQ